MTPAAITAARARLGLSKAELARRLNISRAAVTQWENGKRNISPAMARALESMK